MEGANLPGVNGANVPHEYFLSIVDYLSKNGDASPFFHLVYDFTQNLHLHHVSDYKSNFKIFTEIEKNQLPRPVTKPGAVDTKHFS